MNFFSKLFTQEIIKGYKLEKEEKKFFAGTNKKWLIKQGIRTHDSKKVSIFILKKSNLDKNESVRQEMLKILIKEGKNLMKVRHPSFLKILEPVFEDPKQIIFVTERIENSIESALKKNFNFEDDIELKLNIKNILVGFDFLNNKLNTVHLNIAPENIFVISDGKWKIGGLCFLKTIFEDNFNNNSNFNKIDQCVIVKPNYVFSSPEHFTNINSHCDIFSFTLVLYQVFASINNKSNVLPEKINSQSEAKSFLRQILGLKKNFILEVFPEDLKLVVNNILKENNKVSIAELMNNSWFNDSRIKILNYMSEFLTKSEQQQKDFICSFYLFLEKFSIKIILNQIIPFLKGFMDNKNLRAYILSLFVLIIEKNILNSKTNREIIWPLIKNFFNSKHLNSHMLYVLIFYIENLITLATNEEIESLIYPFFLKCMICKHSKTQQLVLLRIQLIFNKVHKEDLKKKIFLKILTLLQKSDFEIVSLSLKFLINNIQNLEKEFLSNQMFDQLELFLKNEKKNYKIIIYDQIFDLITKMYEIEQKDNIDAIFKYLKLFLILLTESNISREVFRECYEMVQSLFKSIKRRESTLEHREICSIGEKFKYVSIFSTFKKNPIVSEDVLAIINNKNSNEFFLEEKNNSKKSDLEEKNQYKINNKINLKFKKKTIQDKFGKINFNQNNSDDKKFGLNFNKNSKKEKKNNFSNPTYDLDLIKIEKKNNFSNPNFVLDLTKKEKKNNFDLDLTKKEKSISNLDLFQNMKMGSKSKNNINALKINNDLYDEFDFGISNNTNKKINKKNMYFSSKKKDEDKEESFI